VAGGLADIATASDTNGSVRIPACFCGLIGLRTSHGRIPLDGTMPLAPSLDTFGWFARDAKLYQRVGDVLLDAFPGPQTPADALRRPLRSPLLEALLSGPDETGEYRRMATAVAEILGPPAEMPEPPSTVDALYDCILRLQAREAWEVHGAWVSHPGRRIADAIRDRFLFGASLADADLGPEEDRRAHFRAWLGDVLGTDGVLVMPTSPAAAPRSDSAPDTFVAFRQRAIRMLCWSGLSGFPQITLPLGSVGGAPFGISLLGPAGSDRALIRLGRRILDAGRR
ncbi:MAG: amidase, partial [Solirubrobacterales bacterium]|nr:amidase [Solirubrobacterales bacterium]